MDSAYPSLPDGVMRIHTVRKALGEALRSETRAQHELGGQATNTLTGTFFTPFADPFSLTGQSGQFQANAQFITRRLEVKGQGEVKMHPDPDRSTPIPIRQIRLIC